MPKPKKHIKTFAALRAEGCLDLQTKPTQMPLAHFAWPSMISTTLIAKKHCLGSTLRFHIYIYIYIYRIKAFKGTNLNYNFCQFRYPTSNHVHEGLHSAALSRASPHCNEQDLPSSGGRGVQHTRWLQTFLTELGPIRGRHPIERL